jgi:hypothetical protein
MLHYIAQNLMLMVTRSSPAPRPLPKDAPLKIDISSGPAMVTPPKLLQRDPQWIDCLFCKKMAQTKVTLREEKEEPSGYVK